MCSINTICGENEKNKLIVKGISIVLVLVLIGVIIVQSTGSFKKERNGNHISNDPNDFLNSETWWNENQNQYDQTTLDYNETYSDFTNSTIVPFIEKIIHRYPLLKQMGKEMGLTKQDVSKIVGNLGNDNMIKTYISIFNRIFNL